MAWHARHAATKEQRDEIAFQEDVRAAGQPTSALLESRPVLRLENDYLFKLWQSIPRNTGLGGSSLGVQDIRGWLDEQGCTGARRDLLWRAILACEAGVREGMAKTNSEESVK